MVSPIISPYLLPDANYACLGKYLTSSSLVELVNSIAHASLRVYSPHSLDSESAMEDLSQNLLRSKLSQKSEYEMVFLLELATSVVLENKDRLALVWPTVNRHLQFLLSRHFGRNPFIVERAVVSILRIVNRNLFRLNDEKAIGEEVLICLSHLLVGLPLITHCVYSGSNHLSL
jgi:hypothetical protein